MIQRADQPFFFLLRLCPRQLYQSPYTVIFSESHGTPSARMHIRVRQAICQLNPSTGQGRAVNSGHSGQCIRSCQKKKMFLRGIPLCQRSPPVPYLALSFQARPHGRLAAGFWIWSGTSDRRRTGLFYCFRSRLPYPANFDSALLLCYR